MRAKRFRRTTQTDDFSGGRLPYYRRDALLSRGEMAFFRVLLRVAGHKYVIAPKVRAADLITCPDSAWEDGFGYFVARHHLDFVLCDPATTRIVAAIELDDRSHSSAGRQKRDEFLNRAFDSARLPLIRFRAAANYNLQSISHTIARAVAFNSQTI